MPRGRPTDEKKDKMVRVRVSDAAYESLVKASGGNVSQYIRDRLEGGSEQYPPALTEMVRVSGGEVSRFIEELTGMLESGEIRLDRGHIVEAYIGLDMEKFFEACNASGKDPQGVIDAMALNIWRM